MGKRNQRGGGWAALGAEDGAGGGHGRVRGGAFKVNKNLAGGEKGRSSRLGFPEVGLHRAGMYTTWPAGHRLGKVLSAAWRGVSRGSGPALESWLSLCSRVILGSLLLLSWSQFPIGGPLTACLSCSTVLRHREGETSLSLEGPR